jgi:hypothetical protein
LARISPENTVFDSAQRLFHVGGTFGRIHHFSWRFASENLERPSEPFLSNFIAPKHSDRVPNEWIFGVDVWDGRTFLSHDSSQ